MGNNNHKTNSSSKIIFWLIGLIAVGVVALFFLGDFSSKKDEPAKNPKTASIDYSNQPFLGKESAPVSIIEFGDYKCPLCKDFSQNIVPIIVQELVDTGKAKFYFMHDSFINVDSKRSAKFAVSVYQELGNDVFWKFHELLYSKQPDDPKYEKVDYFTEQFLIDTLKEVASDQDVDKVVKNFKDEKSTDAWKKDLDYADKLGVTGTPTLVVNGKLFTGKTVDDLVEMVDNAAKGK